MSMILTALVGAALSFAGDTPDLSYSMPPVERRVITRDLDLFTAEGRQTLDRRIQLAARMVCRSDERASLGTLIRNNARCLEEAMAAANRQRDRLFAARGISDDTRTAAR